MIVQPLPFNEECSNERKKMLVVQVRQTVPAL